MFPNSIDSNQDKNKWWDFIFKESFFLYYKNDFYPNWVTKLKIKFNVQCVFLFSPPPIRHETHK